MNRLAFLLLLIPIYMFWAFFLSSEGRTVQRIRDTRDQYIGKNIDSAALYADSAVRLDEKISRKYFFNIL